MRENMSRVQHLVLAALATAVASTPAQAQEEITGFLAGPGQYGAIELISKLVLSPSPGVVGDVAVSPDGRWAFVARLGSGSCSGADQAGVWIVDVSDLGNPRLATFVPHAKGSRPSDGMQVVHLATKFFDGDLLVINNERCDGGGKGGVSLYDVTKPEKPKKISEHFGDRGSPANDARSAFAWAAGEKAYVALADPTESADVDVLDITNPDRPRLIAEYDLNVAFPAILQAAINGDSRVQDMIVKRVGDTFVMLVAYMDAGFVALDVTDPATPTLLGDTDYGNVDPELLESLGVALPPEGNAHYAEFTSDNLYFIGVDEDLDPYDAGSAFNGWGYVHLYDGTASAGKFAELDTYAIEEAHDPAYAVGFGNLSAHEVATDPQSSRAAYVAYSSGGLRAIEIQSAGGGGEIVEVGGYLDPLGNDLWGVEAFVRDDEVKTIVIASDRNGGIWIFRKM